MGDALCMVCNVWNITQVEAQCCLSYRMSTMVSVECMELVTSWQCVVRSMGDALCMVCNVWNITQVEAKCCRMSTMVAKLHVHGAFDILLMHG